jgi:hypothetical protein
MPFVNDIITFPQFATTSVTSGAWVIGMLPNQTNEIRYQLSSLSHTFFQDIGDYTHPELDYMVGVLSGNKVIWDDIATIVQTNSAIWTPEGSIDYQLRSLSANWQNTFLTYSELSADYANTEFVVQTNSAYWADHRDLEVRGLTGLWDEWTQTYTVVSESSSNWNDTFNIVNNNYNDWNITFSEFSIVSADWGTTTLVVQANSAQWALMDGTIDYPMRELSAGWEDTQFVVQTNSAYWADHRDLEVRGLTGLWDEWTQTYTVVSNTSADWNTVVTTVQLNSALWALDTNTLPDIEVRALTSNWENTFNTVESNSASWGLGGSGEDILVRSLTSNWQNTFNEFSTNSALYNEIDTVVQLNSSLWALDTNTLPDVAVRALTSNWESTYTTVNSNSADWGGGGSFDSTALEAASGNWDSNYTTVNSNSANWVTQKTWKQATGQTTQTNSQTLIDVTGLTFAVESGQTYRVYFVGSWSSTGTGNGIRIGVNGPSSTEVVGHIGISHSATGLILYRFAALGSYVQNGTLSNGDQFWASILFTTTASGTVALQVACELTTGSASIHTGTWGFIEKVTLS